MNHYLNIENRFALRALVLSTAATALGGCVIVDDDPYYYYDDYYEYEEPYYTTIDADRTLDTTLGQGAGFFVEYASGGYWTLWTSCDSDVTGRSCSFEANIASSSTISNIDGLDLESYDGFSASGSRTLSLYFNTASDWDGVVFDTDPGESLEIEVYLDGYEAHDYIFWYGDGHLYEGAPWSPVVFEPNSY